MERKQVTIKNGEYLCDVNVSVEEWMSILQDKSLMTANYKDALIKFYNEPYHKSTCKALGEKYGTSPQSFNSIITNFAKAVQKKLNRFQLVDLDGSPTYWLIPMHGKYVDEHFEWTIRPELAEAMKTLNMDMNMQHPLQTIYDKAIKEKSKTFFEWFPEYKKSVTYFRQKALSEEWTDDDLNNLLRKDYNNITSLGRGNFALTEVEKIKNEWDTIKGSLKKIVKENELSRETYDEIKQFFLEKTPVRQKRAATKRVLAALLPNKLTTFVTKDRIKKIIDELKKLCADYPESQNDWLTDNTNFINYCNEHVDFIDPWHSSVFAWYLQEYFGLSDEEKIEKKIEKEENIDSMLKEYIDLLLTNKNLILTGAPGTGKTYLAKEIAKALNAQTEFVQFHPSYDYTDFVEGLRPTPPDENGNIGFERKDGVFKSFCKKALRETLSNEVDNFEESWEKLLELVKNNLANDKLIRIGSWEYGLSTKDSLKYSSLNSPSRYSFTITKKNVHDVYRGLQARPSGAFQKDMNDVVDFMKNNLQLREYQKGTISQDKQPQKYVLIIDEINRGEISKIFGELFFSIDPGYRGESGKVKTQYSNLIETGDIFEDGFYIPENVYIIGTMNDIDRGVESFDFAIRRRFAWKEITATERITMWDGTIEDWKIEAEKRMLALNSKIDETQGLGSAFHIGPAYFLKLKNYNGNFEQLWSNHLEGVLKEYLRGMPNSDTTLQELHKAFNNYSEEFPTDVDYDGQ